MASEPFNPYQPPESIVLDTQGASDDLRPVPWEDTATFPTFWKRIGGMFSLLFSKPMDLVNRVPATDGLAPAWRFCVLMAIPYMGFMLLIFGLLGSVSLFAAPEPKMPRGMMAGIFAGEMLFIVALLMVGMFIYGALLHAMLWMWGGTRDGQGVVQTMRLCGYAWGFVHLGMLVPCLNLFVGIAGLVYVAMGLARIHRTDTWRAVCAVFTPILLCCLGYVALIAAGMSLAAFRH